MEPFRRDLQDDEDEQQRKKQRRADEIAPIQRHRDGVAAGLAECRRGDFYDPEDKRDLGNFGRVAIYRIRHLVQNSCASIRNLAPSRYDVKAACGRAPEYRTNAVIIQPCGEVEGVTFCSSGSSLCAAFWLATIIRALAGPPYLTDDPEPTNYQHFEIYTFIDGMAARDGTSGESGINSTTAARRTCNSPPRCLRTTTFHPAARLRAASATSNSPQNIASSRDRTLGSMSPYFHGCSCRASRRTSATSTLRSCFPFGWRRTRGPWSAFGGGGCEINRGGDSQDFARRVSSSPVRSSPTCKSAWKSSTRLPVRSAAKTRPRSAPALATT